MLSSPISPIGSPGYDDRNYLPDCWSDQKRMEVLFHPFRVRDTNPEGWDLKMNFWINSINKWCLLQRKAVFTIGDVRKSFVRGDQLPHKDCIRLVVSHMKRKGLIALESELTSKHSRIPGHNLTSWLVDSMFVKPVMLGWSFLSHRDEILSEDDRILPISEESRFINKDTLQILVESIEAHLKNLNTTCMRYSVYYNYLNKNIFSEKPIDHSTYDAIMSVLVSRNKVNVHEDCGIKLVKFGKDIHIKDSDVTLVKLEATKEILELEADKLFYAIESLENEARHQLTINKNRDKALNLLRRKKRLEAKLKDKNNQIDNIEVIYEQLLDSDSNHLVISAFQLANDILKRNTKRLENVENTIGQVEDTLLDIASLTSEINRPIGEQSAIELDAEEELDQMLKDLEEEEEKKIASPAKDYDSDILNQLDELSIVEEEVKVPASKPAAALPAN